MTRYGRTHSRPKVATVSTTRAGQIETQPTVTGQRWCARGLSCNNQNTCDDAKQCDLTKTAGKDDDDYECNPGFKKFQSSSHGDRCIRDDGQLRGGATCISDPDCKVSCLRDDAHRVYCQEDEEGKPCGNHGNSFTNPTIGEHFENCYSSAGDLITFTNACVGMHCVPDSSGNYVCKKPAYCERCGADFNNANCAMGFVCVHGYCIKNGGVMYGGAKAGELCNLDSQCESGECELTLGGTDRHCRSPANGVCGMRVSDTDELDSTNYHCAYPTSLNGAGPIIQCVSGYTCGSANRCVPIEHCTPCPDNGVCGDNYRCRYIAAVGTNLCQRTSGLLGGASCEYATDCASYNQASGPNPNACVSGTLQQHGWCQGAFHDRCRPIGTDSLMSPPSELDRHCYGYDLVNYDPALGCSNGNTLCHRAQGETYPTCRERFGLCGPCQSEVNCLPGYTCVNYKCVRANGQGKGAESCNNGNQCESGECYMWGSEYHQWYCRSSAGEVCGRIDNGNDSIERLPMSLQTDPQWCHCGSNPCSYGVDLSVDSADEIYCKTGLYCNGGICQAAQTILLQMHEHPNEYAMANANTTFAQRMWLHNATEADRDLDNEW